MQKTIRLAAAATGLLCFSLLQPASANALDDILAGHARGEDAANFARLQPLAAGGNAQAQFQLGILYAKGWAVPQDRAKAALLYQQSASQNFPLGENALATAYQNGWGVPRDWAQANVWMTKSANDGNPIAQRNLGLQYAKGLNLAKDPVQAYFWFTVAQSAGTNTEADLRLVSADMTPAQIAQAQHLASDWQAAHAGKDAPADKPLSVDDKKAALALLSNMKTPTASINPDAVQMEAARHVLAAVSMDRDTLRPLADKRWSQESQPFLTDAVALPAPKSTQAAAIIRKAAAEAEEKSLRQNVDRAVAFFASHVPKDSMAEYLDYWNSPENQKFEHASHELTLEERQARGKLLLAHPKAMQMTMAILEFARERIPTIESEKLAEKATFRARVCAGLHGDGIAIPSCAAPGK